MLSPFKFVFFVLKVIRFIVTEQISDASGQVVVDAAHIARRCYDGIHVCVTKLDTLLNLQVDKTHEKLTNWSSFNKCTNQQTCFLYTLLRQTENITKIELTVLLDDICLCIAILMIKDLIHFFSVCLDSALNRMSNTKMMKQPSCIMPLTCTTL